MKIQVRSFWPGVIAFTIATILFCLPGDKFPEDELFNIFQVDKLIHIGLFASMVILWSLPFISRIEDSDRLSNIFIGVALAFVLYGILIEFIQGNFIRNRAMGIDDMLADALGCGVGFIAAKKLLNAGKSAS
jgi:VanZ family protein